MPSSEKDNSESNQTKKARVDHQTMPTRQVSFVNKSQTGKSDVDYLIFSI